MSIVRSLGFLHAGYTDANGNLVEYGDGSSTMGSGSQTYGLTGAPPPVANTVAHRWQTI